MPRYRQVMRDEEVGNACSFLQVRQQVDDRCLDGHIEGRCGFIADDETRLGRDRPGDRYPLLLPSGEGVWITGCCVGLEATEFKQLPHSSAKGFSAGHAMYLERLSDDRADSHPAVQGSTGILEDDLHPLPQSAKASTWQVEHRLALEEHISCVGWNEPENGAG